MKVVEFGRALVTTGDLDPLYIGLVNLKLDRERLAGYVLAYLLLYDAGESSDVAEADDTAAYWTRVRSAKKRGTERRHLRGKQFDQAVDALAGSSPLEILGWVAQPRKAAAVIKSAAELRGFGPWAAWKTADMIERVGLFPVDFSTMREPTYSEPLNGAVLAAETEGWPEAQYMDAHGRLLAELADLKAPPFADRALGIQESETIFCKFKSHQHGHYQVGHDAASARKQCDGRGSFARDLAAALP